MINLAKKRVRFLCIAQKYNELYQRDFHLYVQNHDNFLAVTSGILNIIWNNWNLFWRNFWVAHLIRGVNFCNKPFYGLCPNYDEQQALYQLLVYLNKRRPNPGARIAGSYQEATWGDPNIIIKLAVELRFSYSYMNYLASLMSHYIQPIEHFKIVRNSLIHLNHYNIKEIFNLKSYYRFHALEKIIFIPFAREIVSNELAINYWLNNMKGLLLNITMHCT